MKLSGIQHQSHSFRSLKVRGRCLWRLECGNSWSSSADAKRKWSFKNFNPSCRGHKVECRGEEQCFYRLHQVLSRFFVAFSDVLDMFYGGKLAAEVPGAPGSPGCGAQTGEWGAEERSSETGEWDRGEEFWDWGVRQRRGVLAPIYHHYWGQQRSQGVRVDSGMCKNHVLLFSSMISQNKDVIDGQAHAWYFQWHPISGWLVPLVRAGMSPRHLTYLSLAWMTAPGPRASGAFNFYAITILRPGAAQTVILKQETTFLSTLSHPGLLNGLVMSQTVSCDVTNVTSITFLLLFCLLAKNDRQCGYCVFCAPLTRRYRVMTKWG